MRRMSFFLTQKQVLNKTKTVTRRNGWKYLKVGDIIQPVVKCQGLKKGEKQQKLGEPIEVVSISMQALHQITKNDLIKEGFPNLEKEDFIQLYTKANNCDRNKTVARIEYKYL